MGTTRTTIYDLTTPALLIEREALEHNLDTMDRMRRGLSGIADRQFDPRLLGIPSIENDRVAHQTAQFGPAAICEFVRDGLLVVRLPQADLDELMVEQGAVERAEHTRTDPALPDLEERFSRIGESAQKTTLKAFERGQ